MAQRFVLTENGIPIGVEVPTFPKVISFYAVMASVAALYTADHSYRVLVVDSAPWRS